METAAVAINLEPHIFEHAISDVRPVNPFEHHRSLKTIEMKCICFGFDG